MDIKQTVTNAVNKVEEAVGIKEEVQTPTVETTTAPVVEPVAPVAPQETVTSDRSAYNCPDCKGEGLKDENTKCPRCGGTGKV